MKLIDTCVVIAAANADDALNGWAEKSIAQAVAAEGAGVSAITLAELFSHADSPVTIAKVTGMGLKALDVPATASELCGKAYKRYLARRKADGMTAGPKTPLPDFFIGAHAELMGFDIVTNDTDRFRKYFPSVKLITPHRPPLTGF